MKKEACRLMKGGVQLKEELKDNRGRVVEEVASGKESGWCEMLW